MKFPTDFRLRWQKGFSLLELLIVLAIISVLATVGFLGLQGILSSTSVSSAGQRLQQAIAEARQFAITRSRTVEIRFYQEAGGTDINGYSLVLYQSNLTVDQRLTKVVFLPPNAIISGDNTKSTLLGVNLPLQTEPADGSATSGLTYASVRFGASGGLKDMSASATYYYLLVVPKTGNVANINSADKIVLSVDPLSGIVQYNRN